MHVSSFTHMTTSLSPYARYVDGVSHHTRHIASIVWVFYTPELELLSSNRVFLGHATNNIVEYMSVIELLIEAIYLRISNLVVWLDSQMVVMGLNNHYHIRNLILLHYFLRVGILE